MEGLEDFIPHTNDYGLRPPGPRLTNTIDPTTKFTLPVSLLLNIVTPPTAIVDVEPL